LTISASRLRKTPVTSVSLYRLSTPEETTYVAIPVRTHLPSFVRWSFLLFVFSLPFEPLDLSFSGSSSLARITGLLFFGSYVFYYNPFFNERSFASVPRAMWWFLGYVAVYAINFLFISEDDVRDFVTRLITLVQLIVLFWISSSLLEQEKMARSVLLGYVIAASILAVGIIAGLPGFSAPTELDDGRQTGLGWTPNSLGTMMALAALMPIGLVLNSPMTQVRRLLLLSLMLPLLGIMVGTGSRAGVGAFVIGCVVYALPFLRQKRRLSAIILAIVGVAALGYMVAKNPDLLERWKLASEGDLASREDIYSAAIEMILERPAFGWQPVEFVYELGARVNAPSGKRDAHNLILWVLLEVGLIGAIPFLVGLWVCALAAWRARTGHLGLLPMSLFLAILAANMTHTYLVDKAQWLIFALTVASVSTVGRQGKRPAPSWRRRSHAVPVLLNR
jgi:O-antigen ligase